MLNSSEVMRKGMSHICRQNCFDYRNFKRLSTKRTFVEYGKNTIFTQTILSACNILPRTVRMKLKTDFKYTLTLAHTSVSLMCCQMF